MLILILKLTKLFTILALEKNNYSILVFLIDNSNIKIIRFDINNNNKKLIKKLKKLKFFYKF